TSWSFIEHMRRLDLDCSLGLAFQDWGIPTPKNIELLRDIPDLTLMASGGIRTGIDMVKALLLGASLCGIAAPLLKPAMESADAVANTIRRLKKEFTTAQFLLGISHVQNLIGNRALLL
ncbi:MAG: alpha-hydroxy-acid oxidizing protein, partial [Kiritimatiellae bacterium]|nr:alpha-hydroxy-acid oxidizing protein [Kiritimatiellia bacterium]